VPHATPTANIEGVAVMAAVGKKHSGTAECHCALPHVALSGQMLMLHPLQGCVRVATANCMTVSQSAVVCRCCRRAAPTSHCYSCATAIAQQNMLLLLLLLALQKVAGVGFQPFI
jgi:hypothetical protein